MHPHRLKPGSLAGGTDQHPDRAIAPGQRSERSACFQKQMRIAARRTAVTQVVSDHVADIGRQRQPLLAIPFAANDQLPGAPVNV